MGNFSGLFFMLGGGLGCSGCGGNGRRKGSSDILGVSSLLSDMYFVLSVRACGYLLQGVGQFWLQLWWQKNCSAICSAFISSFVGVL